MELPYQQSLPPRPDQLCTYTGNSINATPSYECWEEEEAIIGGNARNATNKRASSRWIGGEGVARRGQGHRCHANQDTVAGDRWSDLAGRERSEVLDQVRLPQHKATNHSSATAATTASGTARTKDSDKRALELVPQLDVAHLLVVIKLRETDLYWVGEDISRKSAKEKKNCTSENVVEK